MNDLPLIPLFDVKLEQAHLDAVSDTLRSGWLTMGPRTQEFEQVFAEHLGCEHAIALANCTAALHLAYLAAGVGPGDEVIVPPITFVATAAAARYCGAEPVFADIKGKHDLSIDPEEVERRITDRTKAVCAVHYGGYAADLAALRDLCDDARDRADRGRRPQPQRRDGRRLAQARHLRPGRLLLVLLQQGPLVRRGRPARDRRRRRRRAGAQPALAHPHQRHLGPPPRPRARLRRARPGLQLPHGRAAGRSADRAHGRPRGRHRRAPPARAPLPLAARRSRRRDRSLPRRGGRRLLLLRDAGRGRRPRAARPAAAVHARRASRSDERALPGAARAERLPGPRRAICPAAS